MSGKQERKLEELSVNGPTFRSVLEQARKRQKDLIGLRAMIDEAGAELREIVLLPGEIQRMVKGFRDARRAEGDPGADEQADQLEAMLVEIRRRVEQGTLRFSRKAAGKGTAGRDAASSNGEATGQNGLGGSAAPEGEGAEGETPPANESGDGPQVQAFMTNAEADPTDDGDDEGGLDESSQSPEPETAEMADEDSDSRDDDQEAGDGQASQPDARATDWRNLPGGDGSRDDS